MVEAPVPLAAYPGLETDDVDEARERLGQVLSPHRLLPIGGTDGMHVVHRMAELGGTAFHYVDYGTDMEVRADELGFVLIQIPLAGHAVVRGRAGEVISTVETAAVSPATDAPAIRYLEPNPRLMIRLEPALLESRLRLVLGDRPRRPVVFDPAMDLTSPGGRSWRRLVDTVVSDFDSGGSISRSPLAAASLERALVDGFLSVHPSSYSERIRGPEVSIQPRTLRRAVTLIEDHSAEPLTTADVAEAVGVSVRSLQEAFRNHLGTTPMAYLRAVRLRQIHAELLAAGDGVTVTDVALRWGVTHAGRFAQEYRRAYGQTPSETLRRGR